MTCFRHRLLAAALLTPLLSTAFVPAADAATILFEENFDSDPGSNTGGTNNAGTDLFSDSPTGLYATNGDGGATFNATTMALDVSSFERGNAGRRHRANGFLIDVSSAPAGDYDLEFDISNFEEAINPVDTGTVSSFEVNLLRGLDTTANNAGKVNARFGANSDNTFVALNETAPASVSQLVAPTPFTGDGVDLGAGFTLPAGMAGDFLLVTWQNANFNTASTNMTTNSNSFTIDNVKIETAQVVPEPAAACLILIGAAGVMRRRRI